MYVDERLQQDGWMNGWMGQDVSASRVLRMLMQMLTEDRREDREGKCCYHMPDSGVKREGRGFKHPVL